MPVRARFSKKWLLLLLLYAILAAAYVWYTSPNNVPAAYKGTAADPATYFTSQQLKDSEVLNPIRNWIFFTSIPWEWLIYLFLLSGGLARYWRDALERSGLPLVIRFPLFVLLVDLASFVLYLPLRIFSYWLSKHYGITTQPAAGWIRDKLVSFGVGYLTMLAVSIVAFWILSRRGRWWLKLWLVSVPFTVFMMYVEPVIIDPLYNHFTTLSDPQLEAKILDLAAKADIPADRVYEADMSKKTNAINAYVTGIGSSLRIVLWDTTLKQLTEPEILLIMAHEMGHYAMHHLEWSAVGAVGSSLAVIWLGGGIYVWCLRRWGEGWGIRSRSDMTALPLLLLIMAVLSVVSLPVSNAVSRHAESSADAYAMKLLNTSEGEVSMQQKTGVITLSDVNPPLLVRWFRDDHPSDMERIIAAMDFAKSHGQAGS
ncbi:M48 family metallopeptidase [Paenibacillus sacheonensis]|uniref:M48 family metalloprotease n=1 Tax=Paenibacillus sacheonensis TaxID=742054 RepID=A0A7X5C305_9BACL|nr:M48 family metallopeptidase [Paenibacillus sacheonensis]MBM7567166.1 Zn-dependent protease with chaperone function [Paenibacillus sacheonensis]NBC70909.1 M48 family metalloprotease [Paenibacillus sacheonensis]